jgi:hypothetical protein
VLSRLMNSRMLTARAQPVSLPVAALAQIQARPPTIIASRSRVVDYPGLWGLVKESLFSTGPASWAGITF